MLVLFPDLGKVSSHGRCIVEPSNTLDSADQSYMLQGCPLCGLRGPFFHARANYCEHAGRWG